MSESLIGLRKTAHSIKRVVCNKLHTVLAYVITLRLIVYFYSVMSICLSSNCCGRQNRIIAASVSRVNQKRSAICVNIKMQIIRMIVRMTCFGCYMSQKSVLVPSVAHYNRLLYREYNRFIFVRFIYVCLVTLPAYHIVVKKITELMNQIKIRRSSRVSVWNTLSIRKMEICRKTCQVMRGFLIFIEVSISNFLIHLNDLYYFFYNSVYISCRRFFVRPVAVC